MWGITIRSNDSHNKKLDQQINQIMHYKPQGLSGVDTYKQIKVNSDVIECRVIFVVLVVVFIYVYLR